MTLRNHHTGILAASVVALIAWAYGSSVHNGAVWDDVWLTMQNTHLASLEGLFYCLSHDLWTASALGEHSQFYRPLPMLDYAIDRAVLGNTPSSYHVGNLIVHTLVSLALGAWMALRTKRRLLGLVGAAVFATLPLASEPVFWISGRFDSLGLLFVLFALLLAQLNRRYATAIVVMCVMAAVACKEPFMIVAPLFLAIDDFVLVRKKMSARAIRYAAMFGAELLWLVIRKQVNVASASTVSHLAIKTLAESYSYLTWTFAGILVDGRRLDAFHPYAPLPASSNVIVAIALAAITIATVVVARRRWSKLPVRVVAAGWMWTVIALGPVTLAGPTLEIVGDRYAYVPVVGVVLMLVGACALVRGVGKLVCGALIVALVGAGIYRCRARSPDWASDRTLVLASLRTDPGNGYALGELGSQYALAHDWARSEPLLLEAISKNNQTTWRARTALCFVYLNTNRLDEAEEECHKSLEINGENPRAWLNLATVETRQKRWRLAVEHADQAIAWRPTYAEAHFVRALALANMGRLDEARSAVARALEIDPNHRNAQLLSSRLGTAP